MKRTDPNKKRNTEKKMDKVLRSEIYILTSFHVKALAFFFSFFFLSANKNTRDKRKKRIYILQVTEAQVINPCW